MQKRGQVEIGTELPVDALEHVPVKSGGHAARIVVRELDDRRVLDQVGAEQQPVMGTHYSKKPFQELNRLQPLEVADVRAQEEEQAGRRALGQSSERFPVFGSNSFDTEPRILCQQIS